MNVLRLSISSYRRSQRYLEGGTSHFLMYVFARFRLVRSLVVWFYSLRRTTPLPAAGPTFVEDVNVDAAVQCISQDGYFSGLRLRADVVEELQTFSALAPCFGDGNRDYPFLYADRVNAEQQYGERFKLGRYNHALLASPLLQALSRDPQLLAIAREYLRTEPVLIGVRMWWSFVGPADADEQRMSAQGFHYDIDGYRGLTFFFYLTDVGLSNGPHVYVRGSHNRKSWKHTVSIYKGRSDAEINECYGLERQVVSCGSAGSGFAEDILGFHKGVHPESGDRLIVQLRYGLRDYGTGRND
jgi:hypothetical protein